MISMNIERITNFGVRIDGIYIVAKGIVLGLIYGFENNRLFRVFSTGDIIGLDKYYCNIGLIDYFGIGDFELDNLSDDEFKEKLKDKNFCKLFSESLKELFSELSSFSKEDEHVILYYNMKKLYQMSGSKRLGLPRKFVEEAGIDRVMTELQAQGKVILDKDVYIINKQSVT